MWPTISSRQLETSPGVVIQRRPGTGEGLPAIRLFAEYGRSRGHGFLACWLGMTEYFGLADLRPASNWTLLELAVHVSVYLLIEEREEALDLGAFRYGVWITPDDVRQLGITDFRRPVGGNAFVRTARVLFGWDQDVHPHVFGRNVVAR